MSGEMADRPWAELFPRRTVRAVSGEPAVLIELVPAPGVPPFIAARHALSANTRFPGLGVVNLSVEH